MNVKHLFAAAVAVVGLSAQAATIDLAGAEGTGFSALIGFKAAATLNDIQAQNWKYPYYFDSTTGTYRAIAAAPQSTTNDYSPYLPSGAVVLGQTATASNFATFSAGGISYDASVLTGSGVETIGVGALSLTVNSAGFSPYSYAEYNPKSTPADIGNFAFNYQITATNLTGSGLTFTNGVLTSIDLDADINVSIQLGTLPAYVTDLGTQNKAVIKGGLSISGDSYAFNVRDTGRYGFVLQQGGVDLNFVINRAGSIAAVTAVPEPSTYALMMAGLLVSGVVGLRRRHKQ